jgi:hypothetical protein
MQDFEALAAYANLDDTPDSWRRFRLAWPHFFPDSSQSELSGNASLTDWLYTSAENWAKFYSAPENQAVLNPGAVPLAVPPLLWYRNLLRAVWKRNDPNGAALCAFLGFDEQARHAGLWDVVPSGLWLPLLKHDERSFFKEGETKSLPPGFPILDEKTYTIRWEFGCQFQRAVYALMQYLWRAKVCPQCGKYFIAGKTAQKFCSSRCFGEKKNSASLTFYHRHGKHLREKQKNSVKKSTKRGK